MNLKHPTSRKECCENSRQHGIASLPRAQQCHDGDDNADGDDDDADHVEGTVVVPAGTDVGRLGRAAIGHGSRNAQRAVRPSVVLGDGFTSR